MVKDNKIEFLLIAQIQGIVFNPLLPKGLEFKPDGDSGLRFVLMPANSEDAHGGFHGLECKVYGYYEAKREQIQFVDSYKNNVMLDVADNIELPFKPKDKILIEKDGSYAKGFRPKRYLCPEDIAELVSSAEIELADKMDRFLKLLRWRQGVYTPGEVIKYQALYWRVGEGGYYPAPTDGGGHQTLIIRGAGEGISWSPEQSSSLQLLWQNSDLSEPLGHALLREAAAISKESPRSSIMIMVSALEAAVKIHVSKKEPNSEWLLENISSPPIPKILSKYLILIHPEAEYLQHITPFIRRLEKLFTIRNKVAHTGKIPAKSRPIQEYLELVSDMLCLLDVLDGHEWAKPFARYGLQEALGWPRLSQHTATITWHS